ncbi:nickel/cobalt transporter [Lonsdalea quercina]|uniref:nickel/cobalt transporter n=1 Tax=Lonsdalea quercina TaxID=71657 RepID=UPI003974B7AD
MSGKQRVICGIAALLFIALIGAVVRYWPDFLSVMLAIQIDLHRYLVGYLLQLQRGDPHLGYGVWLLVASFIYGVLHAIGPGHGKFIITTYLSVSHETASSARILAFLGAMTQGLAAILFVYLLVVFLNVSMGDLSLSRWYMEKISALYIGAFAVVLMVRAVRAGRTRPAIRRCTPVVAGASGVLAQPRAKLAVKPAACCGHHAVNPAAVPRDLSSALAMIAAIGIRPCTGAIMILAFANAVGCFNWGVAAVMAMALGTALAICALATWVIHSRDRASSLFQRARHPVFASLRPWLLAASGLLLFLFALLLFSSTLPANALGDALNNGC